MAVDEGRLDEVIESKRSRLLQRRAEGFEDEEEDEENEEEEEEEAAAAGRSRKSGGGGAGGGGGGGQRKRGRPSAAGFASAGADSSFTRPSLDRKKDRSAKIDKKLFKKMKFLVNCVIKYKDT